MLLTVFYVFAVWACLDAIAVMAGILIRNRRDAYAARAQSLLDELEEVQR